MSRRPRRIKLSESMQRLPTSTKRSMRRQSIVELVVAFIMLVMILGALGAVILGRWPIEGLVGVVLMSIVVGVLAWNGIRRLRALPPGPDDQQIKLAAPYAFEIDGDTIRFPGSFGYPAENWSLADTTVLATMAGLRLSSPGHRARRYPPKSLAQSPQEVAAILTSAKGS